MGNPRIGVADWTTRSIAGARVSHLPRLVTWVGGVLLAAATACAQEKPHPANSPSRSDQATQAVADLAATASGDRQLLNSIRGEFQKRNPKLTKVGVLDLKAWDFLGPRLVLGWAIVGDMVFRGDFNDEMFGVFVVDEDLTRVERVVDTFQTRSWFDYEVRFTRFTADSVEVFGRSATYGDDPTRRVYKWR